jgi:hypothetical protein
LPGIVQYRLILRRLSDALEGGNSHRGQKADDDYDYHDLNQGETSVSGLV